MVAKWRDTTWPPDSVKTSGKLQLFEAIRKNRWPGSVQLGLDNAQKVWYNGRMIRSNERDGRGEWLIYSQSISETLDSFYL
jgi:hypothetical protein